MGKKKIGSMLAASAIICATSTVTAHAQDLSGDNSQVQTIESTTQNTTGVVINCPEGLNLRRNPNMDSEIVRLLPNGSVLEILGESNGWTRVKWNDIYGYVDSQYIKVNVTTSKAAVSTGKVVNTGGANLNLRQTASTNSTVLVKIPANATVDVLSKSGNWYKVKYSNKTGYVSSAYIQVSNTTNSQGSTSSNTTQSQVNAKGKIVNTGGANLNLRQSTSTSSTVLIKIPANATVDVVSKSGNWYKVKYSNKTGYVSADYIQISSSTTNNSTSSNTAQTTVNSKGKVVNTGGATLNLRQKASTSSTVLVKIPANATVDIISKTENWYKVKYSNKTGYVSANYIELTKNNTTNSGSSGSTTNGDVAFSSAAYVGDTEKLGLFMRSTPNSNGVILLTIPEGATLNVTAKNGAWYKVSYGGKTGYAHSSYIVLGNKPSTLTPAPAPSTPSNGDVAYSSVAYVGDTEGLGLFMRSTANSNGTILLTIPEGAVLNITAKNGAWYKVSYGGKTGYAHSSYIVLGKKPTTNAKATFLDVYNVMKAHIGTPYVWGGSGEYITDSSIATLKKRFPNEAADGWYNYIGREYYNKSYRAFDCSGLMQWGFAQVGIKLGRTTYSQVNDGVAVSLSNVQPGDLLITKNQGHIGMYVGNGQWIESPEPGYSIRISNVNWNNIGYARRVLK